MSSRVYLWYLLIFPILIILFLYVPPIIFVHLNKSDELVGSNNNSTTSDNISRNLENTIVEKKRRYHIPKFMMELYEKNNGKNYTKADLVKSVIPTQAERIQENDIFEELSENHLLIFNIPKSAKDEKFLEAELKILTQIEVQSNGLGVKRTLTFKVYKEDLQTYLSLGEYEIYHLNDTWLSFNLTQEVAEILLHKNTEVLKIIITISSIYEKSNRMRLSLLPITENFEHDYPILILSYSIESKQMNKRVKRSIIENDDEEEDIKKRTKRNNCIRKSLYIDFSEISYDLWIIQPSGYDAYQCHGKCFYPVAEHLTPTHHAIMQALIHSVNPDKASRSCCVPTVLDSISILYVDNKGVLTYRYAYKDMVVVECGCR